MITIAIRLYDTTTTRRYHDAFDYDGSDRNYDSTAIRQRQDKWAWSIDVNHGDTWLLLTRYSNSIQTLQTFISVIITFVITVPKGSFSLVQIYKIFNFFIVHKSHVCCDVNYYVMKPSCAAAAVRCPAYCHDSIGNDAYDASKKLTRQFFRRSLVVVS